MTETYLNVVKECRNLEACVKQNEEENDLAYINTETDGQKRFEARLCQTGTSSNTSIFSRTRGNAKGFSEGDIACFDKPKLKRRIVAAKGGHKTTCRF